MTTYRVLGYDDTSPTAAAETFRLVLSQIEAFDGRMCLTAHANDLDVIRQLAGRTIENITVFGWRDYSIAELTGSRVLPSICSIKVISDNNQVLAGELWECPFYDWSEIWTTTGLLSVHRTAIRQETTSLGNLMEPEVAFVQQLKAMVASALNRKDLDVNHCSTLLNNRVIHVYSLRVGLREMMSGLVTLLALFSTGQVLAGLELKVSPSEAATFLREGVITGPPFPNELCLNVFRTTFAISPHGFSYPVPNLSLDDGIEVFRRAWTLRTNVTYLALIRRFVAWGGTGDLRGSRTSNNYAMLGYKKGKCIIRIGLEQFGEKDVPVRLLRRSLEGALRRCGLSLSYAPDYY